MWAAMEEVTAESVLNRLAEKIHSKENNHLIMAHLPLLLVCPRPISCQVHSPGVQRDRLFAGLSSQSDSDSPTTASPIEE